MFDFDDLEVHAPKLTRESAAGAREGAAAGTHAGGAAGAAPRAPESGDREAERNALLERLKREAALSDRREDPFPPEFLLQQAAEAEEPSPAQQRQQEQSRPDPEMEALLERLKTAASADIDRLAAPAEPEPAEPERPAVHEPDAVSVGGAPQDTFPGGQVGPDSGACRDAGAPCDSSDLGGSAAASDEVSDDAAGSVAADDRGAAAASVAAEPIAAEEPEDKADDRWAVDRAWGSRTALFEILGKVLPMHLERESELPCDVAKVWVSWGVAYGDRLKFGAQPDSPVKWLNPREDELPSPPAVTKLDGKSSILQAVQLALTQRDEEAQGRAVATSEKRQRADQGGGRWKRQEERFRWRSPVDRESDPAAAGFQTGLPLFQPHGAG